MISGMKRPSPSSAIPAAAVPKKFRSGPPTGYTQQNQHYQQQQGHYNNQQPNQYQAQAFTQNYQFHPQPTQPLPYPNGGNYYDQSQASASGYYSSSSNNNNNGSYYSNDASGYQMSSASASSGYGQPQQQGYSNHGGNSAQMYGSAGPSTAGQQQLQQGYATGAAPTGNRTIFFGNVINGITLDQLLDHISTGPIESARILPDKSCAFVTFIYPNDANAFLTLYPSHTLTIGQTLVNLNWGKKDQDPLSPSLQSAVGAGATRNVYITGIHPTTPVAEIYADMEPFGMLDQVRVIPPRGEHTMAIGFVHFASIHSAISCVQTLASVNPKYYGRKVAYGKDRCAPGGANSMVQRSGVRGGVMNGQGAAGGMPQQQQQLMQQQQQPYGDGYVQGPSGGYGAPSSSAPLAAPASAAYSTIWPEDPTLTVTNNLSYMCSGQMSPLDAHAKLNPTGSARTLYFGNLPEDVIPEDVCNVVRAGLIERVHMHHRDNKRFVFVTFVDPRAASLMFYLAETYGVVIRGRKARVSWGKHTGPVQQNVAQAVVSSGATRCVYVGGLAPFCRSLVQAYGQTDGTDVVMTEASPEGSGNAGETSTSTSTTTGAPSTNASTGTPANLVSILAAQLREELRPYGEVEVIYAPADKPIAFVHFMDMRSAIRAVAEATPMLRQRLNAANLRIGYARDRCADPVKLPAGVGVGQAIGGTIPRRITGSYHPAEGLRTGAAAGGQGHQAAYSNQYAASAPDAGASAPSASSSGAAGQGAASLPRKPMLNVGLRHGHGGASAAILASDSTSSSAAEAAAAAVSDVAGYVDTGDDDPAAGVRDEMLDDMVEH
ncbi:hypothetical protein BCR44DRAFT_37690 [Catenaria anguillulae PL171]|uniref:RRM domain-containing protein n=1 Tax=Catenaria anguillulae PL171 TaxID=765915 RepID=A0A1Y2I102_9FUNG|nr:hypothetical protein BCR44DRAFT_37690 [Catenaria anguillulae PL171]